MVVFSGLRYRVRVLLSQVECSQFKPTVSSCNLPSLSGFRFFSKVSGKLLKGNLVEVINLYIKVLDEL